MSLENLGKKIKRKREELDLTQESLAKKLGISRSALSQIENADRKISVEELIKLSKVFGLSLDTILGRKKEPEVVLKRDEKFRQPEESIRIAVPQKNLKKFKEVLLYILEKVGAKSNVGETVLYKLLYFIDFDYYEKYEEQLIGATYQKNRYGPTPIEFKKVIDTMIKKNEVEKIKTKHFDFPQTKYLPLREPDLTMLKANELQLINEVLRKLSSMSAKQISRYSHRDVPWLTTNDQGIIEYESVFYRAAQYSVREEVENNTD